MSLSTLRWRHAWRRPVAANFFTHDLNLSRQVSPLLGTPRILGMSSLAPNQDALNSSPPFDKVLVANRGEIVQRVIRTCRDLGIQTVAVYSTSDAAAPFVAEADEAICLGGGHAQAYLNSDALLRAIADTGAQAVHPGYGFLSERADFCQLITEGTQAKWLGPPASAMQQMGDKLESKLLAKRAGVNYVPGYDSPLESVDQALELCQSTVPFPVLLKAAAGGGGKGMRICQNEADLREAWDLSRAEALQFFGDDRLLLEKYVENPHHIEFQVLCNTSAKTGETEVVVFPERECSIQRRNQKIIEESPAVILTDETRQQMVQQVIQLCQEVKYESAGTLEFLVDPKTQDFFFLEMNTRLQVEHPVTEMVCQNIDLVKGMLYIGAGWGFPEEIGNIRTSRATATQELPSGFFVPPSGHAMEARIYAEDPLRSFLPSTGPLVPYVEPTPISEVVRVDSGVAAGHIVTPHYDPMLSKVITHGPTRIEAIGHLQKALDEYVIGGLQHNARLVQAVLRHSAFVAGETPTSFLHTHFPDGFQGVELTPSEKYELAATAVLIDNDRKQSDSARKKVVVRLGGFFGEAFQVLLSPESSEAAVVGLENDIGKEYVVTIENLASQGMVRKDSHLTRVEIDGNERTIQVLEAKSTGETLLQMHGANVWVLIQTPREYELSKHIHQPPEVDTSNLILSPMPGTLVSLAVKAGDDVVAGQQICIIEAMKMQNSISSARAGTVASVAVQEGDTLAADQLIVELG